MSLSIPDFWKLASESRLLSADECQRLSTAYQQAARPGTNGGAAALADWLVSQRKLTRYQAKILLARRAGPFVFGDYRVVDRVEGGRLAGLFRAVHIPTSQPVSLYFLSGQAAADPAQVARLAQRAAQLAAVRHPHVARTYHFADLGSYKFVVLADLQGKPLEEAIASKPLSPVDGCRLARQIAAGLSALHAAGQLHGELLPANVWLDTSNNARLLHFPSIKEGAAGAAPAGSNDYLAPESAAAGRPSDPRSEIYSLGCVMYRMLAGRTPPSGGAEPPRLDKVNTAVPAPVAQVVGYMLAKDPGSRYQQAAHVVEALSPYVPAAAQSVQEPVTREGQAYDAWLSGLASSTAASRGGVVRAMPVAVVGQPGAAMPVAQAAPVMPMVQSGAAMAVPQAALAAAPAYSTAPPAALSNLNLGFDVASDSTPDALRRTRRKNSSGLGFVVATFAILAIAGGAVAYFARDWFKTPVAAAVPSGPTKKAPEAKNPDNKETKKGEESEDKKNDELANAGTAIPDVPHGLVAIDGEIWQSPTTGKPLDFSYFPAEVQAYIGLRPADIWKQDEGKAVLESLGPFGQMVEQKLTSLAGLAPDQIERAVFGLIDGGFGKPPLWMLVVAAREEVDKEKLLDAWGKPEEKKIGRKTVFQSESMTYFLPPEGKKKLVIAYPINDEQQLKDWLTAGNKPPDLLKSEALRLSSDSDRHFALFVPNLQAHAVKELFTGAAEKLHEPFESFLINEAGKLPQAGLLSLHLGDDLFIELRLLLTAEDTPEFMTRKYRERVQSWPDAVEDYLAGVFEHEHAKKILRRYPRMIEQLGEYTRSGVEDRQAVLRCYLPSRAAHNLALGTQFALLEPPGVGGAVAAAGPGNAGAPAPQTLADKLKANISMSFPRNTLEKCMEMMGEEMGVKIEIIGGDLQLDGITKNQSFGLDEKDKPAFEILKTIMLKANPAGKLIYILGKEGDQEVLKITTRAAAEKRGDKVPPELAK